MLKDDVKAGISRVLSRVDAAPIAAANSTASHQGNGYAKCMRRYIFFFAMALK